MAREKASLREAQRDLLQSPSPSSPRNTAPGFRNAERTQGIARVSRLASFVAITGVLKKFDAIDEDNTVTQLGALVASIKGDNELLLALALLDEATLRLQQKDRPTSSRPYVPPFVSEVGSRPGRLRGLRSKTARAEKAVDELWRCVLQPLAEAQSDAGLGPDDGLHLRLDDSAAGLVEAWASGAVSWEQLSESTSLDHGDLIRLLRRTLDVLRTTASLDAAILPSEFAPVLATSPRAAAVAIDRPPVHDTTRRRDLRAGRRRRRRTMERRSPQSPIK